MRLIDADALLVALRDYWAEGTNETGMEVLDKIIVSLENKGADAEPTKHGEWIGKPIIGGYSRVRCSVCDDVFLEINGKWKYCPHCGAKMMQNENGKE